MSTLEVALEDVEQVARVAVDDLRRTRRHRRIGDVAWGDLAYRVYTTTLGCIVFAIFASGWVGDHELSAAATADVVRLGPAWAGLGAAIAVLFGLRSGSRGGPLALEGADVYHLLLAPIDRSRVLRRPATGIVGYGIAGGAAAGGLAGALMSQRLPGSDTEWIASGVLYGGTVAALLLGSAMVCASRKANAKILIAISFGLVVWSVLAVAEVVGVAPFTWLGSILFWPLTWNPVEALWVVVAALIVAAGFYWIGGLSIEAAQRRTRLVGQLRFAVTQQDLRSVLLLRRQLSSERPRNTSRIKRIPMPIARRFPVFARDVQSAARWPAVRIIRVLVLCIGAALACRGIWSGTTPLILVAGLATYIAALDAIEPMAQEVDHPMMVDSYPIPSGVVMQHHLAAPVILMALAGGLGAVIAWAISPSSNAARIGAITVVSAAATAVSGASVSVASEAILDQGDAAMMPPEVAGPRVVFRMAWPPAIAIIGFTPVIGAQRAARLGHDPLVPAVWLAAVSLGLSAIVFIWVRYREDMHRSMREAMGG
ncbi:MAG: hypothetical protein WBF71_05520 [Microthrixaceae bacterium]